MKHTATWALHYEYPLLGKKQSKTFCEQRDIGKKCQSCLSRLLERGSGYCFASTLLFVPQDLTAESGVTGSFHVDGITSRAMGESGIKSII